MLSANYQLRLVYSIILSSVAFNWSAMAHKPEVDYSLYLVTGRDLLPPGKVREFI